MFLMNPLSTILQEPSVGEGPFFAAVILWDRALAGMTREGAHGPPTCLESMLTSLASQADERLLEHVGKSQGERGQPLLT